MKIRWRVIYIPQASAFDMTPSAIEFYSDDNLILAAEAGRFAVSNAERDGGKILRLERLG